MRGLSSLTNGVTGLGALSRGSRTGANRAKAALLALTLVALSLATPALGARAFADTAPVGTLPATVSTDALPTAQIDGVVWTQLVVGDTVYVGGKFNNARPAGAAAGSQTVTRTNLLAYNVKTGALTSFAPNPNGEVRSLAVSPDGSRLYVGGAFTVLGGGTRNRLAAINVSTGAVDTSFAGSTNAVVYGIAATASTVYVTGSFSTARGVARNGAAAMTPTGALLPWAPVKGTGNVRQVVVSPDGAKVVLGGSFITMNGSSNPGYGLAAVDATNGTTNLPLPVNSVVRNGQTDASILSLVGTADGFYGSGYVFNKSQGNTEGAFKADWNGNLVWLEDCHGDSYSVFPTADAVYVAGHPHYCGNVGGMPQTDPGANWTFQRGLAFSQAAAPQPITRDPYGYFNFEGKPRPTLLHWYPDLNSGTFTGQSQGPWSVSGNNDYLVYGGEFTTVNGKAQQGMVRFARRALAPNTDGPRLSGAQYAPTVRSFTNGVRVSWAANHDRDNEQLTYTLLRNGSPVGSPVTKRSNFWQRPMMSYLDTGTTPGTSYSYRVRVSDPLGNTVTGDGVSITPSGGATLSTYDRAILNDSPQAYWPLGETSGAVADLAGTDNGSRQSGVTTGVAGAIAGDGTAYRFNGSSTSYASSSTPGIALNVRSIETWFRTSSKVGGKVVGFGSAATGNSTSYDRQIYLSNSGQVYFGVQRAAVKTVNSAAAFNDGQWHHVLATADTTGLNLFVDGQLVGSRPDSVSNFNATGFWRIGGDTINGWPGNPTTGYFNGDVDQVALYREPLPQSTAQAHYALRVGGAPVNTAPTASFTAATSNLKVSVDASASSDSDGTVTGYAWDYGDGSTGTGVSASHTYLSAGTYSVKLTVTDNGGATATQTKSVTVAAAPGNVGPTASFTSSTADLKASFDASGSSDPDGTISDYAWDFGDEATGSGATVSHTYTSAGTYPVKLTVTDNTGATASQTKNVTVSDAPVGPEPFVSDSFGRTLATGLGTADKGGAWTLSGGPSTDFSVNGSAGLFKLPATSATRTAYLGATLRDSADTTLTFSTDKLSVGGPTYLSVLGRRVSSTADYRTDVKLNTNNTVSVNLAALKGSSTAVALGSAVVVPGTITADSEIHVRMQAFGTGTGTTTVRAKVWLGSAAEPASWTVSTNDDYAGLQQAGSVGFRTNLSGSATNAPRTISLLDIASVPVE